MEKKVDNCSVKPGDSAPYFSLPGTDGKIYSLRDFNSVGALVVIFTCNHCPYAQAYESRLIKLAKEFQPKGASFVAISSNDADSYPEDNFERMVEKATKANLPYPYLFDATQSVAKAYEAQCTPEVYVFNNERMLTFHGAVDDNHSDEHAVKNHYLRDAIEATLAGTEPPQSITPVFGCSIKWKI